MTEEQFLEKVEKLIPEINDLIRNRAKKILTSGCINLSEYDNNFLLPKLFMSAIGEEIAYQFSPTGNSRKDRQTIKNIQIFL